MIARRRIRCAVVAFGASTENGIPRGVIARDLLPWADPYVAQLIKNLQDEVREERRMRETMRRRDRLSQSFPVYQPTHFSG
jgi:hypothetical protein